MNIFKKEEELKIIFHDEICDNHDYTDGRKLWNFYAISIKDFSIIIINTSIVTVINFHSIFDFN